MTWPDHAQSAPPAIHLSAALAMAGLHIDRGEVDEADALVTRILAAEPDREEAFYLSGLLHERAGRLEAAADWFRKALARRDDLAVLHCGLGRVLHASGSPDRAVECFQRALARDPASAEARCHLAAALIDLEECEEACALARLSLELDPRSPGMLGNLGTALGKLGHHEEAAACFRRALNLPSTPAVAAQLNLNLGRALRRQDRFDEALSYLRAFPADEDPSAEVLHEIGLTLTLSGRFEEGIAWIRRALARKPLPEARYDLGIALLRVADFHEGWKEYEWRWRGMGPRLGSMAAFRGLTEPLWDGSPFPGRTLLLHAEQGFGDTLQFARYVPMVAKRGGTIILEVQPELTRLLAGLPGVSRIVARGEPLPEFDLQCPLLSLPLAFGTTLETIPPPVPYLLPKVRRRSGGPLQVGLVWAGSASHANDRNRSISLELLKPLLADPGISYYSLQVGPAAADLERAGAAGQIQDLSHLLTDFTHTADALVELDLLITVDTSVAHLAGALGVETWVLIPFIPDWRWLLDREDSPWYPGLRLFRQSERGDWPSAIERVRLELEKRAAANRTEAPGLSANAQRKDPAAPASSSGPVLEGAARARQAADFIPSGAGVLDLDCGRMAVERYLPPGCTYIPCDAARRDERTILCDLNSQPIPRIPGATHVMGLGVLDHVADWRGFLKQLRALNLPALLSYSPPDFASSRHPIERPGLQTLCDGIQDADLRIQASMRFGADEIMIRVTPEPRAVLRPRRVAVLSYNNVGNFGDRLGYYLINSILPAETELHYVHFNPWDVPSTEFDLAIVGMGTSIFQPLLNNRLLSFLDRVPLAVGIFGTQYRQAIDRKAMGQLLDRLSIWFARHEEDALCFGRGRSNVEHLGDWLISAFPMAQWNRDETLRIGQEIWQDLPLDRTIQKIQQYRSVHSTRVHPLLCALTSAAQVAYREQREAPGGGDSGKFRSLMLDIFGRTYPEDRFFTFNRDAVAAYRAKVLTRMAAMPGRIAGLLGSASAQY